MTRLSVNIEGKNIDLNGKLINILKEIKFSIEPGEFVVLLGPSGCGKTTILRTILGLDNSYDGTIELDGKKITKPGIDRGIVFQEPRLIPWMTVEENVSFAIPDTSNLHENDEKIAYLITLVGLNGFEKAWPNQLSGGMAQRVAIARALVNVPKLLLMDEPLGALDSFTRRKLQSELAKIHKKEATTTLMVTHDVDEAIYLSNKIIIISMRPASLIKIIKVGAEFPRDQTSQEYIKLRSEILEKIGE